MTPIVGIGELLWDVYPDGRMVAGGAPFNFAFHCHQLGHPAAIVSRVGDDDLGRELRERVRELGLSDEYIQTDRDHPTGTVRVTLDANKVPTYTITENVAWDHIECGGQFSLLSEFAIAACFGLLAQRTEKSRATTYEFLTQTRARPRVFDANLRQLSIPLDALGKSLLRADWLKVNEDELKWFFTQFGGVVAGELNILRQFRERLWTWLPPKTILVTRGAHGCEIFSDKHYPDELFSEPSVPARVVDTVGAGDAFTAAMVCLHLEGRPLRECARFANHYAARVCEYQGATPRIDRREVELAAFGRPG
jgi:fructokinase